MPQVPGYPTSIGSQNLGVISRLGPLVYAAGGLEVEAREFGLKYIDFAGGMDSDNGLYFVTARIDAALEDTTPRQSVFFRVSVALTGAEVADAVNLSAVTFRLWAVGI